MIRRFRSFIVALALLVSFTVYDTRNASAVVDPFTAYVVASAVIHAVIIGGAYVGYKYYKKENGGSRDANGTKVTPNGTIGRDATVTWVDISTGVPAIRSKNVTAKITNDKLKAAVKSNPSKYPKLSSAFTRSDLPPDAILNDKSKVPSVGKKVEVFNGADNSSLGWYSINSIGPSEDVDCIGASTQRHAWESGHNIYHNGYNFVYAVSTSMSGCSDAVTPHYLSLTSVSPVQSVPRDSTPQESASSLSGSPVVSIPENVYSDYYQEIDDYITDNPNVMEYVDTEDSSQVDNAPVSPAPSVPSASQYQSAVDTKAAIDSAQKAATTAQTAADNAKARYESTGTEDDKQKWLDAQAIADKAKADADALASDKSADASEKDGSSYYSAQKPAYGDGKDTDFGSRLDTFFTDLKGTSLFSLPDRLLSGLPSGGSPVCTVNAGRWGVHQIDFSTQSTSLNLIKTIILIGFTFAGIRILVLKGGSG